MTEGAVTAGAESDPERVRDDGRGKAGQPQPKLGMCQKKIVLFINPRLMSFTRPVLLAVVIGTVSLASFVVYTHYLLNQCEKRSFTATTRSEMLQWFDEKDSFDPMNDYKKNWKCLHYTAKLMASKGDLYPQVSVAYSFHNDYNDNCEATGTCGQRYVYKETPGDMRYEKCDIGTVRYTTESKDKFTEWLRDISKRMSDNPFGGAPSKEVEEKLKDMLVYRDGAVPNNVEGFEEFVWIAAHDVHRVPGAFDEVMRILSEINIANHFEAEKKIDPSHPVWLYLQSKPYIKFNGDIVESENIHKFEQNGGMKTALTDAEVNLLLQDPRVRLRSEGGGQFPGYCGEKYDYGNYRDREKQDTELWYGTDRRRSAIGVPGKPKCHYGPNWEFNLTRSVVGFEFQLRNKRVVQTTYDDRNVLNLLEHHLRVQYIKDNRHLTRSMFCNPADYDAMILYRAQPGEEHCTADKADAPECTLVRKCDLTGMLSADYPGFTSRAALGEPALQSEYGSFLAVYDVCPKLIDTMGVAFGFIGQLEMFVTLTVMLLFMCCGCVRVSDEEARRSSLGKRMLKRIEVAGHVVMENDEEADNAASCRA